MENHLDFWKNKKGRELKLNVPGVNAEVSTSAIIERKVKCYPLS
jgi:hypothetical protein